MCPVEEGKVCMLVAQEGMARVSDHLDSYPLHVQVQDVLPVVLSYGVEYCILKSFTCQEDIIFLFMCLW